MKNFFSLVKFSHTIFAMPFALVGFFVGTTVAGGELSDVPAVSDPGRRLYRGLGLRRGKLSQLLGWSVLRRGASAFFSGHRAGRLEGDGTQMPGVFLVHEGRVVGRFMHTTAADRPDYVALCRIPNGS